MKYCRRCGAASPRDRDECFLCGGKEFRSKNTSSKPKFEPIEEATPNFYPAAQAEARSGGSALQYLIPILLVTGIAHFFGRGFGRGGSSGWSLVLSNLSSIIFWLFLIFLMKDKGTSPDLKKFLKWYLIAQVALSAVAILVIVGFFAILIFGLHL